MKKYFLAVFLVSLLINPAQAQKRFAKKHLIDNEKTRDAHIGISIYSLKKDKAIYEHNSARNFAFASNNKIYTLYAAKKYLKDSTTGIQYQKHDGKLFVRGTGDPTLLHPDFKNQAVFDFLKRAKEPIYWIERENKNPRFGFSWVWDDYTGSWQAEINDTPIYGNVIEFSWKNGQPETYPSYFKQSGFLVRDTSLSVANDYRITREETKNLFTYNLKELNSSRKQTVPFVTSPELFVALLGDTLQKNIFLGKENLPKENWKTLKNVPLDSMLKKMMHRSDNHFAEQSLAMVSGVLFNELNNQKVLKHLIKYDFFFERNPLLRDGSGLSVSSFSSPNDILMVLKLVQAQMDPDLLSTIFPSAGEGTLEDLYEGMEHKIHAKTGTNNRALALSGYLTTRKNNKLLFSVVINGLTESYSTGREQIEKFVKAVYEHY